VILSPIIIVFYAIKEIGREGVENNKMDEYFKIADIFKGIFMPVVFISYISLMLVAVVTMQRMMVQNEDYAFNNGQVFVEKNRI
jgi:ABC-type dipeptide/oligopeptide/nickel transport system permease component